MKRFLITLLFFFTVSEPVFAANIDAQNYRRAFALIDSGHVQEAAVFAAHGHDPILNKVIRGLAYAQPGSDAGFDELANFIASSPDWPGLKGVLAIAEQKIPANASPQQVVSWFAAHPPVSLIGFYRYIDALNATGQTQNVAELIRTRWINGDLNGDELTAFHARFAPFLNVETHAARLDRLLWKNEAAAARRMYPLVDDKTKAVAEARLALAARAPNVDTFVDRVPSDRRDDAGLLYERLRWHIRNNHDDEAVDILNHAPTDLGKAEAWWEQRQIMARRFVERKDYGHAYKIAVNHGPLDAKHLAEAEFLAGWLALRFLDEPEAARQHFQTLYDNAMTPISRARGAYWLGRTYEAHGDKNTAEQAYETAAALNITYYGQLAAARIYAEPMVSAAPEPAIPPAVRNAFYNRDLIRAVERLREIGERDRVRVFFTAATEAAQQRADFALLTELAYRVERPDLAIEAGKAASKKNMLMASGGFPLLDRALPPQPDPAFVHALIRQESLFNPEARSPVGAVGLMQLMPATAKGVARKLGMPFREERLRDPDYNIRLGTVFVQNQVDNFEGSYVLALAGYNAGPRRVREWMTQIGDPRSKDVDVVDWVESIPVYETRNYVQRIMESLQVYRARMAGGQARLMIMQDLKR